MTYDDQQPMTDEEISEVKSLISELRISSRIGQRVEPAKILSLMSLAASELEWLLEIVDRHMWADDPPDHDL
jgi:hypothetical protein